MKESPWWKNPESLTYRLMKCYPDRMTNGREETQITIRMTCGFELWGGYETWDSGFEAEDWKGNKFSAKTMEKLIEQIEMKLITK